MPKPRALSLILSLSLVAMTGAQTPETSSEPEGLTRLRADYEIRARAAAGPLNGYYISNLAALESRLAAAGDYEQARAAKAEREAVTALLTSPAGTSSDTAPGLELKPSMGKPFSLALNAAGLTSWRTSSYMDWSINRVPPGLYAVELEYALGPPLTLPLPSEDVIATAELQLREQSTLGATNAVRFAFSTEPPLPDTAQKLMATGNISLARQPLTLRLSPVTLPNNAILTVVKILLKPATAPSSTSPGAIDPASAPGQSLAEQLDALRKTHSDALRSARLAVIDPYMSELAKMAGTAQEDLREEIEHEQNQARRLAEGEGGKGKPGEPRGSMDLLALGVDNFKEINGATFVSEPTNTGDLFTLEHEGQRHSVRLAFITCPPVGDAAKPPLRLTTQRFGISDADAVALGTMAREFVHDQLHGKPLRVLLRNSLRGGKGTAADGPSFALIFVDGGTLLQNQLIDAGLAVVEPWRGKIRPPLHRALEEREASAKKSLTPMGGWALTVKQ